MNAVVEHSRSVLIEAELKNKKIINHNIMVYAIHDTLHIKVLKGISNTYNIT